MIKQISELLNLCDSDNTVMPPTMLYNEGGMLRLILDWFSQYKAENHPFSFAKDSRWYSEILLPSPFQPRFRSDPLSETYTHADGAIGHFTIGKHGKGDINLSKDAKQLIVIEAKMFSKFSRGTKNFKDYDQAARNVACIAQIVNQSNSDLADMVSIGFYVIAPSAQLENEPTFNNYLFKTSITNKVLNRVQSYRGEVIEPQKLEWYENYFLPIMEKIDLDAFSWEQIIEHIQSIDYDYGFKLYAFYEMCLDLN